jgi:large subunit ribosomal protein L18
MEKIRTRQNRLMRKARVRGSVNGTSERPRLTVSISLQHVSAQIINDDEKVTLASASTVGTKMAGKTMTEKAIYVGEEIAAVAKKAKITRVVLDRNGRKYHGRIAALADAARKNGLEF